MVLIVDKKVKYRQGDFESKDFSEKMR